MSPDRSAPSRLFSNRLRCWLLLFGWQCAVAAVIGFAFISGRQYFAFSDAGADTYFQFIPVTMHLARYLASEGFPGWSFQVGLGANLGMLTDPFQLLSAAFGAQQVPGVRIWIYLLKIACGGAFFLYGLLALGMRREAAVAGALAYSFCGYMLVDGQWDPLATEAVFFALLFWALARHQQLRGVLFLPLAVAAAAASGLFMPFSIGVFLCFALIADLLGSENRRAAARRWLLEVWPLTLLGFLLAAPIVIPNAFQLLDSPRVGDAQAQFAVHLADLLSLNDWLVLFSELAAFWHKSFLGVGSHYHGWGDFLTGPEFYVGVLPLLLIPQLWRGTRRDRVWLLAGAAVLVFYVFSPFLRYAAYGFHLNYFRLSALWVSMLLLVLFARALSIVLEHGVDRAVLLRAATVPLGLYCIAFVIAYADGSLNLPHALRVLALYALGCGLLYGAGRRFALRPGFAFGLLAFVALDAIAVGWFDLNQDRETVSPGNFGYADATPGVLSALQSGDPGFYRVEKTYRSAMESPYALCDSLAQDYYGVKSYYFHGSGVVAFHAGLGLVPQTLRGRINYTNWLPGLGERFMLYSLLGVKYVISRYPVQWPGFRQVAAYRGLRAYRNAYALPLGIVQDRQYPRERFAQLPAAAKDAMLMNAAIVEHPVEGVQPYEGQAPEPNAGNEAWLEQHYAGPARRHQQRGLRIEHFSNKRIVGRLPPGNGGILVFSIPDAPGWSVRVDGRETPTFRANLGMLAVRVGAGGHALELRHDQPGRGVGYVLGAIALLLLLVWRIWGSRRPRA